MRAFVVVVIRDMLTILPYLVKEKSAPHKREKHFSMSFDMEIEQDSDLNYSENDLSDQEVEVNAYGSPVRTRNSRYRRSRCAKYQRRPQQSRGKNSRIQKFVFLFKVSFQ